MSKLEHGKVNSKELYQAFLRVTSERYTANALSEVAPNELSHDSVSRWLASGSVAK